MVRTVHWLLWRQRNSHCRRRRLQSMLPKLTIVFFFIAAIFMETTDFTPKRSWRTLEGHEVNSDLKFRDLRLVGLVSTLAFR
eukprot:scaffold33127_cov38-Cyclotella_meneghiniana.AAC.1